MSLVLEKNNGEDISLITYKMEDLIDGNPVYELMDIDNTTWLKLVMVNNQFVIEEKSEDLADFDDGVLGDLLLQVVEAEQSGVELEDLTVEIEPFNPEKIKVHAKQFNLRLVSDMMENGDIDLSPDFQRNTVWDSVRKSRLIESILLRIPLPMFYFSEDNEGRLTIVDGLQRLTAVREFMNNKFPLRKLEYLQESCGDKYFKDLDPKYKRWFNQTQFSVNVIDPSSPAKVKYDIFRRINTGGKPLNNQEIRNCLAGEDFRKVLREMAKLDAFLTATDYSIKAKRMEDQEVSSRFILFSQMDPKDYSGYMHSSLDMLTEDLSKKSYKDLEHYIALFDKAMENSAYLFGKYAFRKINGNDLEEGARKKLINKALFTAWSVLLSKYDPIDIASKNEPLALLEPLVEEINSDKDFFAYLSYGTNGRNNIIYTFEKCAELIEKYLTF